MDDKLITDLYWQRSETAISETRTKYGAYCGAIAKNILGSADEAEECVNDAWLRAWNSIPPERPGCLSAFLGKITRNLAIDRYRGRSSGKSGGGQTAVCLDELAECVGESDCVDDGRLLGQQLSAFLRTLKPEPRRIFVLRYWYLYPLAEIAERCSVSEGAVKMSLLRTRGSLKNYLEREGISI